MMHLAILKPSAMRSKSILTLIASLPVFLYMIFITGSAQSAEVSTATKQFIKKKSNEIIELVEEDPMKAAYTLGLTHYHGLFGHTKNSESAAYYFLDAAILGHIESQFILGEIYRSGDGKAQNSDIAFYWFQSAAHNGHIDAQYNLGVSYLKGMGTEIDAELAFTWLAQAAHRQNASAQNNIAFMYYKGLGTKKNKIFAALWATISVMNKYDDPLLIKVLSELEYVQQSIAQKSTKRCVVELKRDNYQYCHPKLGIDLNKRIAQVENTYKPELRNSKAPQEIPEHVEKLVKLMGEIYPSRETTQEIDLINFSTHEKTLIKQSQNPKEFIKWLKKYPNATDFQKEHASPMDGYRADDVILDGNGISIRVN